MRSTFSDGAKQAVIGAVGNGSESFLGPGTRDLDARWVGGWVDGRGGGIADGEGDGCLIGIFELFTVNGECGVKGVAAA